MCVHPPEMAGVGMGECVAPPAPPCTSSSMTAGGEASAGPPACAVVEQSFLADAIVWQLVGGLAWAVAAAVPRSRAFLAVHVLGRLRWGTLGCVDLLKSEHGAAQRPLVASVATVLVEVLGVWTHSDPFVAWGAVLLVSVLFGPPLLFVGLLCWYRIFASDVARTWRQALSGLELGVWSSG